MFLIKKIYIYLSLWLLALIYGDINLRLRNRGLTRFAHENLKLLLKPYPEKMEFQVIWWSIRLVKLECLFFLGKSEPLPCDLSAGWGPSLYINWALVSPLNWSPLLVMGLQKGLDFELDEALVLIWNMGPISAIDLQICPGAAKDLNIKAHTFWII